MTNRRVVAILVACMVASEATRAIAHRVYKTNWITSELILDESNVVIYCEYGRQPSGIPLAELRRQLANAGTSTGNSNPDVAGLALITFQNAQTLTVQGFENGFEGQVIRIVGDGLTTLENNANFVHGQVLGLLLLANKVYEFVFIAGQWVLTGTPV